MTNEWRAQVEISEEEEDILRLCKKQKFWSFLRLHRHELLDEEVRAALAAMYSVGEKGGRPPSIPERLLLAMLLQVAFGVADHEVPTLTAVDKRWQMVLDCLGVTEPVVSQGTLFNFRERARANGLMRRLLNKTVELARTSKGFGHKNLRVLIDSSPLVGAGRVEDTFNLLGRALVQLVEVVSEEAAIDVDELATELDLSIVGASSIKAALDVDWREPQARSAALRTLLEQFDRLRGWIRKHIDAAALDQPPLSEHIALVETLIEQDTEPDPEDPKPDSTRRRIRDGVTKDRIVSLSDPDMRHGRKSTTKTFNGYKRHIAMDGDVKGLICAVKVMPANKSEHEAAAPLIGKIEDDGFSVIELHADRGYLPAKKFIAMRDAGVTVVSKPPSPQKSDYFTKDAFAIDFKARTITCPAKVTTPLASKVQFPRKACRTCNLHARCTSATRRSLSVHPQEQWYREMASELSTPQGRARRRERTPVEHGLAHVGAIQGRRARYRGLDKNEFDSERTAVVGNCFVLDALWRTAA